MSPGLLVRFLRSIAVLALPAEGQIQWLGAIGLPGAVTLTDELALEFDDGFLLLPQFVEQGWLPEAVVGMARELDSLLDGMSGSRNAALWEVSALAAADEWAEVRTQATRILCAL